MYSFHPKTLGLTTVLPNPLSAHENRALEARYTPYFPGHKLYFIPSNQHSIITTLVLNILAYLSCGLIHRLKSFEDCWHLYTTSLKIAAVKTTAMLPSEALRKFQYASAAICVFLNNTTTSSQAQARSANLIKVIPSFIQDAQSCQTALKGTPLAEQIDAICHDNEQQRPQSDDRNTNLKHIQQTFDKIIKLMEGTVGLIDCTPWDEVDKFNFIFETK
jgi:hypothetical protein